MDKQYSWKRTQDTEIDLMELLYRLCRQWKQAAVCAVIFALILGGYGWLGHRNAADESDALHKEAELTEEEEQAAADAVSLKSEIRGLEEYLKNSVLMQIEPYHKHKSVMLYCIDGAKRQELPGITESYLSFVLNGGAADVLTDSGSRWKMDRIYLAEVITAYQKTYSLPYQIVADSREDGGQTAESLFYVETVGKNAQEAGRLAADIQDVLEKYSARVKKTAGNHRLRLISSQKNVTADSGLQSQQQEKKAQLSASKASLKSMTDAFSRAQMEVYRESAGEENEDASGNDEPGKTDSGGSFRPIIKYALAGMIAGVFLYCCVFSCVYIFRDTVKSAQEMKRLYTFPVYGEIEPEGGKKRRKTADGQVLNRIRLACRKQGTGSFYAASDFVLSMPEKKYLERMSVQLADWGIDMSVAENVSENPAMWEHLTETGNVLLVCRTGLTTHRMVDDAMEFYQLNGMQVSGALVFEHGW